MKLRKLISAITATAVMATSFVFSAVPASADEVIDGSSGWGQQAYSVTLESTDVDSITLSGVLNLGQTWSTETPAMGSNGKVGFTATSGWTEYQFGSDVDWNNNNAITTYPNQTIDLKTGAFTLSLTDLGLSVASTAAEFQIGVNSTTTITSFSVNGISIIGSSSDDDNGSDSSNVINGVVKQNGDVWEFSSFDALAKDTNTFEITYTDSNDGWGDIGFGFSEGSDWKSHSFNNPAGTDATLTLTAAAIVNGCSISDVTALTYGKIEGYNGCVISKVVVKSGASDDDTDDDNTDDDNTDDDNTDDTTDDTNTDDTAEETVDKKSLYNSYGYYLDETRWTNSYSGKILTDDPNATIDIYYDSATDSNVQIVIMSPANWWDDVYSYSAPAGENAKISIPVSALVAMAEDSSTGTVHDTSAVTKIVFPTWSGIGSGIYKVDYNSAAFMSIVQQAEEMAGFSTVYAPTPGTVVVELTSTAKGNEQKLDDYYTKGDEGWVTTKDTIFRNPEAKLVINYTDKEHDGWGDIGIVIEDENGNKSQAVITTSQGSNLETIVPISTALNKMEAAGGGAAADKGNIVGGSIVGWNGCVINKVEVIIDESKTISKEEAAEAAAAPEAAIVEVADLNASGQLTVYSKDKTEAIFSDADGIIYVVYNNDADGGTISFGVPTNDKGWVQYDIDGIAAGKDAEYQISVKALLAGLQAAGYKGGADLNGQLLIQSWGGPVLKAAKYEKSESAAAAEQAVADLGNVAVEIEEPADGIVEIDAKGAELAVALLGADDLEKVKNGAAFKVTINAEEVEDTADYKAAVDELVDNIVTGIFVDVEIFTQVGDGAAKQVTETNAPVTFTVHSDELVGFEGEVRGFRFHGDDIDEIEVNVDAETGDATLKSDKYSVFAIVLSELFSSDVELELDDTDASAGTDNSADTGASAGVVNAASEGETNPHTGVALSGLAVLAASGALAVLSKKRRK